MKDQMTEDVSGETFGVGDHDWLALATEMADVGRWIYRPDDDVCFLDPVLQRLTGLFAEQPMDADAFLSCIHEDDRGTVVSALDSVVSGDTPFNMNFRFRRADGTVLWLAGRGRAATLEDGTKAIIGVNYDVTDLQNAVTANRLLANEMAHRVKNVISLVTGIYRMASRNADNVEDLNEAFLGRLDTLGSLNDLIFDSDSRCVALNDLFGRVFGGLDADPKVSLDLADFRLNGTAAQTVVLAVNELITNAVKYGALGREDGRLSVEIAVDEAADTFDLRWVETVPGGGIEAPKDRKGFGMTVLTQMTRHTFDGDPVVDWRDEGLRFSCRWSAAEMSGRTGVAANEDRLFKEAARATAAVQRID